jgi:hypothetical protein
MADVRSRPHSPASFWSKFGWTDHAKIARDASYFERLHKGLREKSGKPLANNTIDEYRLLLEFMLHNCQKAVKFVSCSLDPEVYCTDKLIKSAREFIEVPGRSLEILVEDSSLINDKHRFVAELARYKTFLVKSIRSDAASVLNINFVLFDGFAYRLEPDKSMHLGILAFGDYPGFRTLNNLYEPLKRFSSDILCVTSENNDQQDRRLLT